jgi:hypothetical protein
MSGLSFATRLREFIVETATVDVNDSIPETNRLIRSSVCGRSLRECGSQLKKLGWKVVGAVRISRSLSIITARNINQHALLYARRGRVCTVNFSRPGSFRYN